ncbi:MAG: DUF3368 domain-containing protein [Bacteroidia bacterium]
MIVVSDTSPVSNLISLGQLKLLPALFEEVVIPSTVVAELLTHPDPTFQSIFQQARQESWLIEKTVSDQEMVKNLLTNLDPGEAEAIALTLELKADALLIDERAGYQIARNYQIDAIGVLGILIRAKSQGLIPQIRPLLDRLKDQIGFYLSARVYDHVLKIVGEKD